MSDDFNFTILPTSKILAKRNIQTGGKVQRYIDNEVLRRSNPLIPFDTGALARSGTLNTMIGSGDVKWNTPYARKQYYENRGKGNRGKLWFERMKTSDKSSILRGAAQISGGRMK